MIEKSIEPGSTFKTVFFVIFFFLASTNISSFFSGMIDARLDYCGKYAARTGHEVVRCKWPRTRSDWFWPGRFFGCNFAKISNPYVDKVSDYLFEELP